LVRVHGSPSSMRAPEMESPARGGAAFSQDAIVLACIVAVCVAVHKNLMLRFPPVFRIGAINYAAPAAVHLPRFFQGLQHSAHAFPDGCPLLGRRPGRDVAHDMAHFELAAWVRRQQINHLLRILHRNTSLSTSARNASSSRT